MSTIRDYPRGHGSGPIETYHDIFYFDTYLVSLIFIRLLSLVMFMTNISKILKTYIFSQFFEFMFLILCIFAFMKIHNVTKQYSMPKSTSIFTSTNYIVVLSLCIVGLPLIEFSPLIFQFLLDLSLILLIFQAMFPHLSSHRNHLILACIVASLILLVIGFSTIAVILHAQLWLVIGINAMFLYTGLVILSMSVLAFIEVKYTGRKAIIHEKSERPEGIGYGFLLITFIMLAVFPISFFSWLIFLLVFFMVISSIDEYCNHVPPFVMWWSGFLILFIFAAFI